MKEEVRYDPRRMTQEQFEKRVTELSPEITVLGKYIRTTSRVLVEDKYGKCMSYGSNLLKGKKPSVQSAIDKNSYISNMFREKHGDRYIYDKVEYVNAKVKVCIGCKTCGNDFYITPSDHNGMYGCSHCQHYESFLSMSKGKIASFYIIKCFNEEEVFYKVGVTTQSIKRRFHAVKSMPYKYSLEYIEEGSPMDVAKMEMDCKKANALNHYVPKINFHGSVSECFTRLKINEYEGK